MIEKIKLACVKYDGELYTGFDHGECFKKLPHDEKLHAMEEGFITDKGRFVNRKEAYSIASNAKQITYDRGVKNLISEDIHLSWLNDQAKQIRSLEEQLKNADIRKYKLNEEVYIIWHGMIVDVRIYAYWRDKEYYYVDTCHFNLSEEGGLLLKENKIFKEYEAAEKRLDELKGETK